MNKEEKVVNFKDKIVPTNLRTQMTKSTTIR